MWKVVFLVILVAYQPLDGRKSSGGGGGRGMSAGRQSGPQGGGFGGQPSGGGFQGQRPPPQQPHYPPPGGGGFGGQQPGHFGGGPAGGFNQRPGGFGGGHSNFGSGSGPGSMSRGSVFKTALAGAALGAVGGLVTYELGKAVLHSFDRPFQHDNKNYYWDQEHYKGQPGTIMCSMPLQQLINSAPATTTTLAPAAPVEGAPTTTPSPDQLLSQVVYPNGTRPKEIVWSCKQGAEVCCGTDCCPAPLNQQQQPQNAGSRSGGHSIGGIIFGVLALLLCCF
uniref:CX domain-containing protein n=1 Tax=Ditylenchus dipsaci TaxID=166011 RepID=A0A915D5Y5_9BILA